MHPVPPWLPRLAAVPVIVAAITVAVLALGGRDPAGPKPDVARGGDLVAFWAGGAILVEDGHGEQLYQRNRYLDEMEALFPVRPPRYRLAYPPPIYQACALAHGLGYSAGSRSFVLFMALLFAMGAWSIVRSGGAVGPLRWPIWALAWASPPMFMMTLTGQFSGAWLGAVALWFAAVKRVRRSTWWSLLAGVPLGLLCVKPTVALAAVVALALSGSGRSLIGFVAGGGLVLALSLALHGASPWHAYLAMVVDNPDLAQQMWLFPERQFTVRALLGVAAEPLGAQVVAGWVGVGLGGVLAIWMAPACWRGARRHATRPLAAAAALSTGLLVTPHLFDYDLGLHLPAAVVSVALLLTGDARRPRLGLALVVAAWLAPLGWPAARWLHLCVGTAALVGWVTWMGSELRLATPSPAADRSAPQRPAGPGRDTGR
jgi:alpha-1,2-mannosyltransferase